MSETTLSSSDRGPATKKPKRRYLSLRQLAERWSVSISQASRLVIEFHLVRLPVSTGRKGKNQGIRISLKSIREYERANEFQ